MFKIEFIEEAVKEFKKLDKPIQKLIKQKLELLAKDLNKLKNNIKQLKGKYKNKYRLRVGNYRIIYQLKEDVLIILIVRIRHRKEAH
ncbi:type II toxin-antitoxin system RelE/ParE family toxin [Caminibacter mediatlanticus TB-2]|uniref:Type II toxin-antitoxin system RelE/ParE family toxin n=1 Tax=Caminibacter mediatlanticus TB-2 TaxID=391592 RepID=A0ABX5V836_9BACT|nr:type II toxin-antitoxin system RelE/ParE family toxin [Caminibacter mediatlanticus]QCT93779.1 type II toxin-antitoxin system RelE/ParE family toxin [Caminibacter mediatlanticus TB-2]